MKRAATRDTIAGVIAPVIASVILPAALLAAGQTQPLPP